MSLSRDDVEKIAHLARLAISEEDIPDYASDLSNILGLVDQMDAVDTDAVTPMAHPLDMAQRLRPDVVTETDQRDQFQRNSPSVENGLFLVPRSSNRPARSVSIHTLYIPNQLIEAACITRPLVN